MEDSLPWPPPFHVKKSARVKHVKLKASARNGLELIVPLRFNQKHIPEILEVNKSWIKKQFARVQIELEQIKSQAFPTEITLLSLNQIWKIDYINSDNKKARLMLRPQQNEIVLLGDLQSPDLCHQLLTRWVKKQAHLYLTQRLRHLSEQTNLPFNDVSIRGQRSRWGSCSADKSVNLNFKLLFLPTHLVDHILIHELCHTKHLNHSAKFWRLVATFDPQWKENSRETRLADKFVPAWLA